MKPNILFIVIDSLRADKCYGDKKTSVTPNIDSLIKNGTYFSQTITHGQSTIPCMSSILTGLYPFESMSQNDDIFVINPEADVYMNNFENFGYNTYAIVQDSLAHMGLDRIFKNDFEMYPVTSKVWDSLGQQIVNKLKNRKLSEPWFYYLHLYDLYIGSYNLEKSNVKELNAEGFGNTNYERMFSAIDVWIGNILTNIDLEKTLLIITADHGHEKGAFDSEMEKYHKKNRLVRENKGGVSFKIGQKIARRFPKSMKPVSKKLAGAYKSKSDETIQNKIKPELEKIEKMELRPYEKRLMKYSIMPISNLYDEKHRVPLIFSGYNIPSDTIISQQVQSVDIFATIADIIGLDNVNHDRRGRSLTPLMQGKQLEEIPAFLESATNSTRSPDSNVIGIRTSEFKYFRDRDDSTKNVHLYDLREDPLEENNIVETKKDVVKKMEKIVVDILKGKDLRHVESNNEIGDEKSEIIESELKRLGYVS